MSLKKRYCEELPESWNGASPARRACCLGLGCALLFLLVNWRNYSNDFVPLALVPVTVLREGTVRLDSYRPYMEQMNPGQRYTFFEDQGHLYSMKPYFVSLLALPIYVPPVLAGIATEDVSFWVAWGRLAGAIFTGTALGLCYLALRRWTTEAIAVGTTLLCAFGTSTWTVVGQSLNYHTGAFLCSAWILYALDVFPLSGRRSLCIGFAAGLCVGMRPTTVLLLAPLGLYLCAARAFASRWSFLAALAGFAMVPSLNALLNHFLHHSWMQTGYSAEEVNRWTEPFWRGAFGILLSPNTGMLVQSPFLGLGLAGTWIAWRCADIPLVGLVRAYALCVIAYIALFAQWYDWQGGWTPASRMLSESYPLALPLVALGWMRLRQKTTLLMVLAVCSIAYQMFAIATFDRLCELEPRHDPWNLGNHFFAYSIREFGWTEALLALARTVGMTLGITALYLWLCPAFLGESNEHPGPRTALV